MNVKTVRGTKDYLPKEEKLRDKIKNKILESYQSNGFEKISTPILEDLTNLEKSDGGENLGLIFKILKRGEKLTKEIDNKSYDNLCDIGLRYDLTLPLSRYYANNRAMLPQPFKCIQIDRVYRAERPQKGRLREFYQCDIDILGEESIYAEIELLTVTSRTLLSLGLKDFTVKINDRRILKEILIDMGFKEDEIGSVSIIFDKLDKIGREGVENELAEKGFKETVIRRFMDFLSSEELSPEALRIYCSEESLIDNLEKVIQSANELSEGRYNICFDKSLVRGMGYYTGMVFEIVSNEFSSSIAGGGRYDRMIGRFLNEDIPAVGFSIGFERIYSILSKKNEALPYEKKRFAVLFDREEGYAKADRFACGLREKGNIVSIFKLKKNFSKNLQECKQAGYESLFRFDEVRSNWSEIRLC